MRRYKQFGMRFPRLSVISTGESFVLPTLRTGRPNDDRNRGVRRTRTGEGRAEGVRTTNRGRTGVGRRMWRGRAWRGECGGVERGGPSVAGRTWRGQAWRGRTRDGEGIAERGDRRRAGGDSSARASVGSVAVAREERDGVDRQQDDQRHAVEAGNPTTEPASHHRDVEQRQHD